MGAQFIKHIIWDDLATSGWKHLFPMQSNLKKFEEIWRFILLIRSLFRRCARRQNLNVVVWATRDMGLKIIMTHYYTHFEHLWFKEIIGPVGLTLSMIFPQFLPAMAP